MLHTVEVGSFCGDLVQPCRQPVPLPAADLGVGDGAEVLAGAAVEADDVHERAGEPPVRPRLVRHRPAELNAELRLFSCRLAEVCEVSLERARILAAPHLAVMVARDRKD